MGAMKREEHAASVLRRQEPSFPEAACCKSYCVSLGEVVENMEIGSCLLQPGTDGQRSLAPSINTPKSRCGTVAEEEPGT